MRCRSCGAEIFFIEYKGKSMPVNVAPRKVFVNLNKDKHSPCWVFESGHESHFATCPHAKAWRKNERSSNDKR